MKALLILIIILFISFISSAQIIITEIMYNPPESGTDSLEFLELYNHSDNTIDLEGWSFTQGITMNFNESTIIEPGEYLTLCVNETAFKSVYGDDIRVLQWQGRALVNAGELLEISDEVGNTVYSVNYNSGQNGWYTEADGNGASIELCNFDADPDVKDSWRPAVNSLGVVINERELFATPGMPNDATCDGAVIITISDFNFSPKDITISVGQLVRWVNHGGHHNVNGNQAVFPDNPVSFFSGSPQSGSWTYEFVFEEEGLYTYQCDPHAGQGMTGTIFVGVPDIYQNVSIPELRQNSASGLPALNNFKVRTKGVVHTPNLRPASLEFFIINEQNIGVSIFRASGNLGYTVKEGDEIEIEGTVSEFRGLTQILAESITILSSDNILVEPRIVTSLNESSEGSLVKFIGNLQDESMWTNSGAGFNVNFVNGSGNIIDVRIVSATEIFGTDPLSYSSIIGVGSQFTTMSPFNSGYQLIPRYLSDLETSTSLNIIASVDFEIFPNPTTGYVRITGNLTDFEYSVFTMSGKEIIHSRGASNQNIDLSGLNSGVYIFIIKKKEEFGIQKIIIQ